VFISLFKGLHFYDIRLHNIYIKHFFVKIDKKLILKANSITIIPQQKVKKDIVKIHKQIYYISKISSMFEELTLKNINYKKIHIPIISYKKNVLKVIFPDIKIQGNLLTYKNYTIVTNLDLKYKNFIFKNINGKINYKNLTFSLSFLFNKNKLKLSGKIDKNDNLFLDVKANNFSANLSSYDIFLLNPDIKLKINLHYFNPALKLKTDAVYVKNKDFFVKIKDIYANYKNNSLAFKILNAYISKIKKIKNIKAKYLKGTFYKKDNLLIISQNNQLEFNYKDFNFSLKNNELIYKNLHYFHFSSKKATVKNRDFNLSSNNILIIKFNNFIMYEIKNNILKSKFVELINDIIYGYKNSVEIPNIKGHYKSIPFNIKNTLINLNLKKAISTEININNIILSPTLINWNLPIIKLNTKTENLKIDNNLKSVLKEFNISIPVTQLQGKNTIDTNITYNLNSKDINFSTEINSSESIFKYEDYLIKYKLLKAFLDKNHINAELKELYFPTDFLKIKIDSNITVYKTYLNAFTNIKDLTILEFVKIKNYNEKIVADFINKIIYFLNSEIFINLKDNTFFLLSLKKIIHFTPFYPIVKDGGIYIQNTPTKIIISGLLELTRPLILNKKDPNSLNAFIEIKDKNITIINNYISTKITNLQDYNISIKNAIIDTKTLIYMYKHLQPIFENNQSNSENNTSVFITSTNTHFVYETHRFLSQKATIIYKKELKIKSVYKKSSLYGYTKNNYFLMEGKNYSKEELVPILEFFDKFKDINLDFVFVKSPDDFYTGKVYIQKGIVKELTTLNNIIAFLNTIPSLLSLSNPGFSAKGYKIKKGFINYLFYKNILYFKQIKIIGENIDFIGKGYIDFNKDYIKLKLTANLKMKLKKIPVVGKGLSYVLFGKDRNINVKILVLGPLENPKVTQDIGKSILLTPFNLFKRTITLPFNLF